MKTMRIIVSMIIRAGGATGFSRSHFGLKLSDCGNVAVPIAIPVSVALSVDGKRENGASENKKNFFHD